MVVGENPMELVKPYDESIEVDEYVVYKKEDAHKIKETEVNVLKYAMEKKGMDKLKPTLMRQYAALKSMTDDQFFRMKADGYEKYYMNKRGDIVSRENLAGRYDYISKGRRFATLLKTVDDRETWQARCRDVDFASMHRVNDSTYETVWEMFKEGRKPANEVEETLYKNMNTLGNYFDSFDSKDDYVAYNSSLFYYAYLDKKTGWKDMDDAIDPKKWVREFYDTYIEPIDPDALISIFECRRI